MDESQAAADDFERLRTSALAKLDDMRDQLLQYHKEVMAKVAESETAGVAPSAGDSASAHIEDDAMQWQKDKQELQERLQESLRRNEQLAMEMAQCRLEDAQLKRSLDQLKHRQVITETQLQHQQAAQDAQRKQLQLKDQLLTNYRTSIRNLENKLKNMVESTYHIQEKEISYLAHLAAKHPRNNLPKPVSPFIAVFMTFLRRTNGLSLVLLLGLAGAITYTKTATEYGMFLNAPVLAVSYSLVGLLGITPYLGWKGATSQSWSYLRAYDAGIICFLALLGLGVLGLEFFQADIHNALAIHETSTNHSMTIQGRSILFPRNASTIDTPHAVTSFIQAEADKAFVLFLQARFDAWFPQTIITTNTVSNVTATNLMASSSWDPRPWLARTFNVSVVFYPEPLKETPQWMTHFIATTCTNTSDVDDTLLTGFVPLPVHPTFHLCLRPILQFSVDTAYVVEVLLLALASLLAIQYATLLLLKFVDPASSSASTTADAANKKATRKTSSSVMHFFDAALFVLGLVFLASSGTGLYVVLSRPDDVAVDTEIQIIEASGIGFGFVYGILLCLSAALGCSPKLMKVQSFVLLVVVGLQLALATTLYMVKVNIVAVPMKLAAFVGWIVNTAGVVVTLQTILMMRNLWTLVLLVRLRKLMGLKTRKPKRTGGPPSVPYTDDDPTTNEVTLPFHVAMDRYWESYPRGSASNEATVAHARHQFTLEWLKVTGASSVHEKDALLTMSQFQSIVRVLVLKRLVTKCGLEVSKQHYDFRNFFQKLCALYGRHALTVVENQFFPDETMSQISRRINVHSRHALFIEDDKTKKMPPPYRYTPYVPYFRKNAMQYLYHRHSTQLDLPTTDVAPSVFQVTDCLKLLHLVIHDEMDTARMLSNGLLDGFSCLHSASRFEWTNLVSLSSSWLTYWRPRHLPGEPDPDKRYFANFWCRISPFRQPLADVRGYFGEQIALYFLWLGFYAQCLLFPVVASILYIVVRRGNFHSYDSPSSLSSVEEDDDGGVYLHDMPVGLVVLVWAFVYAKCWQRKNYMCAIAWGMHGIEDNEQDRADYYVFGLQSLYHFSALLFVSFVKRTTLGCVNLSALESNGTHFAVISYAHNCIPELENLLLVMFSWRVLSNVLGMVIPITQLMVGTRTSSTTTNLARYDLEYELSLATYENTYEDYSEIVVQFGLFTLFIFPLPTGPIFAFAETAINLRMDAYKLCYCTRRPLPRDAQDIGAWFIYLGLLSRLCVVTNLGVLFFTASNFDQYTSQDRWTFYLLSVAGALLAYEALWFVVPRRPDAAANILERHDFLKQKYLFAYDKRSSTTTSSRTSQAIGSDASTTSHHHHPSCQDMLDTLDTFSADALTTLNTRVELLTRFNALFVQKSQDATPQTGTIELTHAGCAPTALTGIDAIREAVRRSSGLFDDDEAASEWYFSPQEMPPPPMSPPANDHHHVRTHQSSHRATRTFMDDAEDEEYSLRETDQDIADVL
ncbi:hypothetical protein DYB25_007148 [Aphanomyces astaci]|uniref:Anoctamin transmembrane domain-containing protein n=2 Tax=Aphanomyces astaci TaxID=112090 RepID=A0A397ADT4_APHAT|nr:hypothetical protein DYB25_007148 [Aphanomyces astaci]